MTKKNIMPVIVLSAICIAAALLLSVINIFTSDRIEQNKILAEKKSLQQVLPAGTTFDPLTITEDYPKAITGAYKSDAGYVFKAEVTGYKSGLIIMVGIDNEGKIAGVKHTASKETFGAETEFNAAYTDRKDTLDSIEMVLSASASKGAPMTAKAYYTAIEAALKAATVAGGGKTPEQQLKENLNAALGATDLTFTKWFATEVIEGVDAIYESEAGRVYVIGDAYVGIKTDGKLVTNGASADAETKAMEADTVITASTLTEITELPASVTDKLVSAHKTASGNYVLVTKGDGYGITGATQASGEHIVVKVSISSEGKILACAVVSHGETESFGGAALENPDFHDSFIGTTDGNYSDVENVSGATSTSKGYKDALGYAFDVFELLTAEGGN